jgi:hypothetical protein
MAKKYSKLAGKIIEKKLNKMKNEDKPKKQKIAISLEYAKSKGFKVPKNKE